MKSKIRQFTEAEAIGIAKKGLWKPWTADQKVRVQLFQNRLCMPFNVFHEAIEKVLHRPVWTHEFARVEDLRKEYLGERQAPTMQEIIDMIPAEKRVVLVMPNPEEADHAEDVSEL